MSIFEIFLNLFSLEDIIDHSPIFGHPAAPIRAVLRWAVFSAAMIIENWIRGFTHDDLSWGLILGVPWSFYKRAYGRL